MKKILVVEDDPVNAMILRDFLHAYGYDLTVATTGLAGLSRFHEEKPDLAIVDVMLPKLNGFEVCFEMKRSAHGKNTPVFLMSAIYKDLAHAEIYAKRDLKAEAYLVKPFDLRDLLSEVQRFLGEA
ncbi:MAG: response regulator transcription factor [Byssovorax sp.]